MYLYRLELSYARSSHLDATNARSMSLIVCSPCPTAGELSSDLPAEFASVAGAPIEKRQLDEALNSQRPGAEGAPAVVISLADYQRSRLYAGSCRVLVADDDPVQRKILATHLERAGYSAKLVTNGEEVLDALAATDFDLLVLDDHMPVMTGIDAARVIRMMQAGGAALPIVMISEDAAAENSSAAHAAGITVFLRKPVDAEKLLGAIGQLNVQRMDRIRAAVAAGAVNSGITPLLNSGTLRELEQMAQNPSFVDHLFYLFENDSTALLRKIERALLDDRQEELDTHVNALRGSALHLGADRLFAHCVKIAALNEHELQDRAFLLAAEMREIIIETHAALGEYARTLSVAIAEKA